MLKKFRDHPDAREQLDKMDSSIPWWLIVALVISLLSIVAGLSSCYNRGWAVRQTYRVYSHQPEVLAELMGQLFPNSDSTTSEIRYLPGRVVTVAGRRIDCDSVMHDWLARHAGSTMEDAGHSTDRSFVQDCPPSTRQVDTIALKERTVREVGTKVFLANQRADKAEAEAVKLRAQLETMTADRDDQRHKKRNRTWLLYGILGIGAVVVILKLWGKIRLPFKLG